MIDRLIKAIMSTYILIVESRKALCNILNVHRDYCIVYGAECAFYNVMLKIVNGGQSLKDILVAAHKYFSI